MKAARPLLIVDDDPDFSRLLAEQLRAHGAFTVTVAGTAGGAESLLFGPDAHFDALILDIGLPDEDGRELCARLRRRGCAVPILMLTGSDSEQDVIRGLDLGANDYLAKPCRTTELMARLRAQLRSHDESVNASFEIGPFIFRPAAKLLQRPDGTRRAWLTDKEVRLLKTLVRAEEATVSRQTLLVEVWGYSSSVSSHTLETHVYRLRQKLEAVPTAPRLLLTGKDGYRLARGAAGAGVAQRTAA